MALVNDEKISEGDKITSELHVLVKGIQVAGFKQRRLAYRTQVRRFKEMYGCHPKTAVLLWSDLRDVLKDKKTRIEHMFWALCFLKKYPTDGDMQSRLSKDPTTVRKWIWTIVFGLQELRAEKIKWPDDGSWELAFVASADGTDCPTQEPRPFSKTWYSQKFKGAAVKHEVALDVLSGRCIWINGPFKGSKNDLTIFREGLMGMIPDGKYACGDKAYRAEPTKVTFPNHLDNDEVAGLKKRIRARQETFFSRCKSFAILRERFRHKPVLEKHKACFEAVAVVVQCGIDAGFPLFAT